MTEVISTTIDTRWAVKPDDSPQVLGHFISPDRAADWIEAMRQVRPDSPRHYRIVKVTTKTTVEAVDA